MIPWAFRQGKLCQNELSTPGEKKKTQASKMQYLLDPFETKHLLEQYPGDPFQIMSMEK